MSTEERDSQLSALFDGELEPGQAELVTRRLLKDPALQATWERYALVGAVLRGEPLLQRSGSAADLSVRVRAQLAAEAPLPAAPPAAVVAPAARGRWPQLAGGVALAASVALAVVGALRWQSPGQSTQPPMAAAEPAAVPAPVAQVPVPREAVVRAQSSAPPSYTTPLDTSPGGVRGGALLADYVVLHTEASAPVTRLSPLLSDALDPAAGAVEMTEAEIGARR